MIKPDFLIVSLAFVFALPGCEKKAPQGDGSAPASVRPGADAAAKAQMKGVAAAHVDGDSSRASAGDRPSGASGPDGASVPAAAPVASAGYQAALALEGEAEREAALAKELKALTPADGADLALATLPADAMRQRLLNTLLTEWAVAQPSATAAWLSKTTDFPEKIPAIRTTADLWQRMDFDGMIRWTASLPEGAARTAALAPIAAHIRTQPAEHRQEALDSVRDPGLRADLERMVQPPRD